MKTKTTLGLLAAAFSVCILQVSAQNYPSKPVRFIVPFVPGGPTDIQGRMLGEKLAQRLGQQVLIDNRGGAGGNIGMELTAKAPPDGYTIVIATVGTWAVNPHLYKLPFDVVKDFAPIIQVSTSPGVLVVHPSVTSKNVQELITLAKSKSLNGGSSGVGGAGHLALELFNLQAGTKIVHIAYKGGGPAIVDLLSGNINLIFATAASAVPHIQTNRIRALAVTTIKRSALVPNLPTIAESGVKGFDANNWYGVLVPAKTPRPIINRLNKEIVAVLNLPDIKDILFKSGLDAAPSTPEQFGAYIKSEKEKWEKVIKAAGLYQTN